MHTGFSILSGGLVTGAVYYLVSVRGTQHDVELEPVAAADALIG